MERLRRMCDVSMVSVASGRSTLLDRLHSVVLDRRGGAVGGKERNQLPRSFNFRRACDDGCGKGLDQLELRGNAADEVEPRHMQELADRLNDDAGVAGCDQRGGLRAAWHDLCVNPVCDSEPREE